MEAWRQRFGKRGAGWRRMLPTNKQIDYLTIHNLPVPETSGEANDIIYRHYKEMKKAHDAQLAKDMVAEQATQTGLGPVVAPIQEVRPKSGDGEGGLSDPHGDGSGVARDDQGGD